MWQITDISSFYNTHDYLIKVGSILLLSALVSWFIKHVVKRLQPRLSKTVHAWDESLLIAIRWPAQLFVWLMCLTVIVQILLSKLGVSAAELAFLSTLRSVVFVVLLFWFMMRYVQEVERHLLQHDTKSSRFIKRKTNVRAIAQVIRVVVVVISVFVVAQNVGFHITSILALSGVGGLVLSFAAKDSLANFFGGMMIFWDKPFDVGDWIRSPDRDIEGTVEHIGWRLTKLRTFDKRPLYVPNGIFSTISIENPQRMSNRRIKVTIGLRYEDAPKVATILKDIEKMLIDHHEIDKNKTLMVNLFEFGASSLNFFIYAFTKSTHWATFQAIKQDVLLKTIDIITLHGAECAFPSTTVYFPEGKIPLDQSKDKL